MAEGEVYYAEDGTASVVLEEQFDPSYEPTQKEMDDYADFIGIDSVLEAPLMWIAREALRAPLPSEWKPCKTDTAEVYYFNFKTGESIWEHPLDEHYKTKVADERANFILTGKSVDPNEGNSKTKKSKKPKKNKTGDDGEKTIKVEKGSAGNTTDSPTALGGMKFEETKKKTPTLELKPKVGGRLGALGGDPSLEGPLSGRGAKPDVSDLLAGTKEEDDSPKIVSRLGAGGGVSPVSGAGGILGGKSFAATLGAQGIGKTADTGAKAGVGEAEEKQLRATLQAETDEELETLVAKHKKQLDSLEDDLIDKKRQLEREIAAQSDVAVEQSKRATASRYSRELTTLRNNLDDELSSVRREVRELNEKLESEKTAADRRAQRAIDDVKMDMDRYVAKESTKQRGELQDAWMAEKAKVEMSTAEILRDLEQEHASTLARVAARVGPGGSAGSQPEHQEQLTALEQELTAQYSQLEMDLAAETRAKVLAIRSKQDEEGNARSQEVQAIEASHHEAMQSERVNHQQVISTIQASGQEKLTALKEQHEAAKLRVSLEVQKLQEAQSLSKAQLEAAARATMEEEIQTEEAKLKAEFQAQLADADRETERQVHDARQRVLQASSDSNAREQAAKEQDLHADHTAAMNAADRQFALDKSTLESRLHSEYEEKRSVVRAKQQQRAKEQGNAKLVQEMAAVEKVRADLDAKLTSMKEELSSANSAKFALQKSKATADCEDRIQKYQDEVQNRKAPDSPLRRARQVEAEEQNLEAELAAERAKLEAKLAKVQEQVDTQAEDRAFAYARQKVEEKRSRAVSSSVGQDRQVAADSQAARDRQALDDAQERQQAEEQRIEREAEDHRKSLLARQAAQEREVAAEDKRRAEERRAVQERQDAEDRKRSQERQAALDREEAEYQKKQEQIRKRIAAAEEAEQDLEEDRRARQRQQEQRAAQRQVSSVAPISTITQNQNSYSAPVSKETSPQLGRPPLSSLLTSSSSAGHPQTVATPTTVEADDNYTLSRPSSSFEPAHLTGTAHSGEIPMMRPTSSMSAGTAREAGGRLGAVGGGYTSREASGFANEYGLDSRAQSTLLSSTGGGVPLSGNASPNSIRGNNAATVGHNDHQYTQQSHGGYQGGSPVRVVAGQQGAVSRDRFEAEQQEAERLRKTLISVRERDRRFSERVVRANRIISEKKQTIRDKQAEIKLAREDWHRDMARAKSDHDTAQQSILYKVKKSLEDQAKICNEEALEVRRASQWVKDQQRVREDKVSRKLDATLSPKKDRESHRSPERRHHHRSTAALGSNNAVASTYQSKDELVALVQTMATRMAKVEEALHKASYPHKGGGGGPSGSRVTSRSPKKLPKEGGGGAPASGKNGGSTALFRDPMQEGGGITVGGGAVGAGTGGAGREEMRSKWGKWLGGGVGGQQEHHGHQHGGSHHHQPTGGQQKMSEVEQWVADTLQSPRR